MIAAFIRADDFTRLRKRLEDQNIMPYDSISWLLLLARCYTRRKR